MMDKEQLLTYINDELVIKGRFYSNQNIPSQISNAIYTFGDYNAFDILGFIDVSEQLDGSRGMIITPDQIYFKFVKAGVIEFNKISYLGLEKHRNDPIIKAVVKLDELSYAFSNKIIDSEKLIKLLSKITNIEVEMIMSNYEKVSYYVPLVLADLENDEYEDIILSPEQNNQIKEFYKELELIETLDNDNYEYELENICKRALKFFDDLELDSDEIDILTAVEEQFNQKNIQENQKINDAQQFYDDMMNKYQQGDPEMLDRLKSMMRSLGIDENELAGKSNDEIQDLLCQRFGISKSMFDKLAQRFNK